MRTYRALFTDQLPVNRLFLRIRELLEMLTGHQNLLKRKIEHMVTVCLVHTNSTNLRSPQTQFGWRNDSQNTEHSATLELSCSTSARGCASVRTSESESQLPWNRFSTHFINKANIHTTSSSAPKQHRQLEQQYNHAKKSRKEIRKKAPSGCRLKSPAAGKAGERYQEARPSHYDFSVSQPSLFPWIP